MALNGPMLVYYIYIFTIMTSFNRLERMFLDKQQEQTGLYFNCLCSYDELELTSFEFGS